MIRDSFHFLGTLTYRKIINLILIGSSYLLSILLKRPLVWGMPYFISIESSALCNLECPQCPVGKGDIHRNHNFLDDRVFRSIIDQVASSALIINLNFQGEPLMNKNLQEWIRYARKRGLYTMTSTNGQGLDGKIPFHLVRAGLNRIIISVDGIDQETYAAYRKKGNLARVIIGIRALADARKREGNSIPCIIIQFLVFRHNQHQIAEIRRLGREWGADRVVIKSGQIEYPGNGKNLLPENQKYSRYVIDKDGELLLKKSRGNHCRRIWEAIVITTDAFVVPCCYDKKAAYPMGSLSDTSLNCIWKNQKYHAFRQRILSNRKAVDICKKCGEGRDGVYIR